MPHHCSAWGCFNRQTAENKLRGITFHSFPKHNNTKKRWEVALRRKGFTARRFSKVCSAHFRPEDFDRTGQTVRLRDGVVPSVFDFPAHLQKKPVKTRTSQTSLKACTTEPQASPCSEPVAPADPPSNPSLDHSYALPTCPTALKARLCEALAKVESLEREKMNARHRERRAKSTVCSLLNFLRGKHLLNKELKVQLRQSQRAVSCEEETGSHSPPDAQT